MLNTKLATTKQHKKATPEWAKWADCELYKVVYDGVEFSAYKFGIWIYAGDFDSLHKDSYGSVYPVKNGKRVLSSAYWHNAQESAGSCAYNRIHLPINSSRDPLETNEKALAAAAWYLDNVVFGEQPTICFVTPKDGKWQVIADVLMKRGFQHVATAKSIHGNYGVRLYVHPGAYDKNIEFPNENENYNPRTI